MELVNLMNVLVVSLLIIHQKLSFGPVIRLGLKVMNLVKELKELK